MVKVTKTGNLKRYKAVCCHCLSELEFTSLDETSEYYSDIPFEGQVTDWSIECPYCHFHVPTRSLTDTGYYEWRKVAE